MNRQMMTMVLCVAGLIYGISAIAGKHPKKPASGQTFEATMSPPVGDVNRLTLSVNEYSSPAEVQDLASTFSQEGSKALEKACSKVKKGYLDIGGAASTPMAIVETNAQASGRTLTIVGLSPTTLSLRGQGGTAFVPFAIDGYPYYAIRIELDAGNKGRGIFYTAVQLSFNQKAQMVVKPWIKKPIELVNVYLHE